MNPDGFLTDWGYAVRKEGQKMTWEDIPKVDDAGHVSIHDLDPSMLIGPNGPLSMTVNADTGQLVISDPATPNRNGRVYDMNTLCSSPSLTYSNAITSKIDTYKDEIDILKSRVDILERDKQDLEALVMTMQRELYRVMDELEDMKDALTEQQGRVILSKDDAPFKELLETMEET